MKRFSKPLALLLSLLMAFCCVSCGDDTPSLEEFFTGESQVYVSVSQTKGKKIYANAGKYIETEDIEGEITRTFYENGKTVQFKMNSDISLINEKTGTKADFDNLKTKDVLMVDLDNGEIFLVSVLDSVTVKNDTSKDEDYLADFPEDTSSYPDDSEKIGKAAEILAEDIFIDNKLYSTKDKDTAALRIDSGKVSLSNLRIQKQGDSTNLSNSKLFGLNSALLIRNSANFRIKDSEIVSDAEGATSIFAYSSGTVAYCDSMIISALGKKSYGAAASAGAILHLKNSSVFAGNGGASAVYAGVGGRVKLQDSTLTADAKTSPALIAAGVVKADNCSFSSRSTEALVISAGADVTLNNCRVSGTKDDFEDITNRDLYSIYIYGDKESPAVFNVNGGELASTHSTHFRVSGASAEIALNATIIGSYGASFLKATDGADLNLSFENMLITPKLDIEAGCSLTLTVKNGSNVSAALGDKDGLVKASLVVEDGGVFALTGDTYLESFVGDYANLQFGGYKLFVAGEEVVKNGN